MNKKNKNAVRIMAWILAILMILSLATLTVSIFVEQCGDTEAVEHDHDGDGVPDHDDHEHEDGGIDDGDADTGDDIF
ncbi:MAG: hypothetical protein IKM08_01705 [Clostridia bacterium]|nr:hypothetical protein [Clostridia bacterium]